MPRITATTPTGPVDFDPAESPTAAALDSWCIEHLPFLGAGLTRRVYAVDEERVLKINRLDLDQHWAGDNEAEYDLWETVKDDDRLRPFFATILDADDSHRRRWIVAERLDRPWNMAVSEDDFPASVLDLAGADLHGANISRRSDGTPVIIDYANNCRVR